MADEKELKIKLTGDGRSLIGTVEAVKKSTEELGKTTQAETDKGAAGVQGLSAEFLQLQDILDPTVANTRRLAAATDLLDRELKQGNLTVERHAALMTRANQIYGQTHGSMRMMRGGIQQLGYQIQDVAVQAQMGVNGFMILSQQGSQIASLFGPGGALLGSVLAIAGAISGALVGSLAAASEEVDELKDRMQGFLENTLTFKIRQATSDLRAAENDLRQAGMVLNQVMQEQANPTIQPWEKNTLPSVDEARNRVIDLGEVVNNLNADLRKLQDQQTGDGDRADAHARALRDQQAALQSLIDTLFPAEAAAREYHQAIDLLEQAIVQFPDQAALYRRALAELRGDHSTLALSLADLSADIEGFNGRLTDNLDLSAGFLQASMDEYYQRQEAAYQAHQDRLAVASQVTAYAFENAWVNALKNGEDLWKQFADTVIDQILRIQYQMFIGQGVQQFFNSAFGGLFPGPTQPGLGGATDFGGIDLAPGGSVPGLGPIDLNLGLRPTASRPAEPASNVVINQVNDFSNVSSADEARIRQMLEQNSRQTEARIYSNINRGGAAARTVGRR